MIMLMNHEGTISTTAAGKASSKEKKLYLRLAVGTPYYKPKGDTIRDDPKSN